jgi:hypothetical protein
MKASRIIAVARFVGGWIIIAFFIALLTFIFSFLGTILCAVLAGMMFGAVRSHWWKALAASLVFPAVLLGVLRAFKTEMFHSQVMLLAILCLATFWGTYWVARALFAHENKTQPNLKTSSSSPPAVPSHGSARIIRPAPAQMVPVSPATGLTLAVLQGKWFCRNGAHGEFHQKLMDIDQEKLTLQVADAKGHLSTCARASIRLCNPGALPNLLIAEAATESPGDTLISI